MCLCDLACLGQLAAWQTRGVGDHREGALAQHPVRHGCQKHGIHPAGIRHQTGSVSAKNFLQLLELCLAHAEKLPRSPIKVQRSGRLVFVVGLGFIVFDVLGNNGSGLFERLFGGVLAGSFFQFPHLMRTN